MTTGQEEFLQQQRFHALDGLRAFSIIPVIWHHTAPTWVSGPIAEFGSHGVTLFFAISGFLITTLLLRESDEYASIDLKAFYIRRALRIFPLYYAVLVAYIVLVATLEKDVVAKDAFFTNLIYFVTYTSNLFVDLDGRVIFYFAWSLAAEEQFYLIWPPILALAATTSRATGLLWVTVAASIAGQLAGSKFLSAIPVAIVAGALLAILLRSKKGFEVLNTVLGRPWSASIVAFLLIIVLANPHLPSFVVHLLCVSLVGACVIRARHALSPLLDWRPLLYIGSISYGIYLLHMLCKGLVIRTLAMLHISVDGLHVFALTAVASIIAAGISFNYYESIFLRMKQQHGARRDQGPRLAVRA